MENFNYSEEPNIVSMNEDELHMYLMNGLLLLGWTADVRFTSEDTFMLLDVCKEAYSLDRENKLSSNRIDSLSLDAFNVLRHQIANVHERADCISTWYVNCDNLKPLIPMIDEATMSFFRGYDLASLSIMFIVLERYLRNVLGWMPGSGDVTFRDLNNSVKSLPNTNEANIAYKVIFIIYSRFDGLDPIQFYFNRHGLFHGLRGSTKYDQMNCVRLFMLFDQLCRAENIHRTAYGDCLDMFKIRANIFSRCRENTQEIKLLSINY